MPFAFLGVLILLSSVLSAAYIAELESEAMRRRVVDDISEEGKELAALVHKEVETEAYWIGSRAIQVGGNNRSKIASVYDELMNLYLDNTFPRHLKGFALDLVNHSSSILFRIETVEDFAPRAGTEEAEYGNITYSELETSSSGEWSEIRRITSYSIAGRIGYELRRDDVLIRCLLDFSDDLDSVLPFMHSKMEALISNVESEFGNLGRMVKYMLSTLAQVRVLEGWGSPEGDRPTSGIVTVSDVERAVNMALVLETLGFLRTLSRDPTSDPNERFRLEENQISVHHTLLGLQGNDSIDPADVFISHRPDGDVNVSIGSLVSQAIYDRTDQSTLRFLDYFGLAPVADLSVQVAETLADSIEDFLNWITGENKEASLPRSWFRDMAQEAGATTLISYPSETLVPESEFSIVDEQDDVINISVPAFFTTIQFPSVDITEGFDSFWGECYEVFAGELEGIHGDIRKRVEEVSVSVGNMVQGELTESSMGGFDPTDDVSVLQRLGASLIEKVESLEGQMRGNHTLLDQMIQNQWSKQANLAVRISERIADELEALLGPGGIEKANETLQAKIVRLLRTDSAYQNLSEEKRADLEEEAESFVLDMGLGAKAHGFLVNRTRADIRALSERVVSMETPSSGGGLYARLKEFVQSSQGMISDGFEALRELVNGILESEDLGNIPFRVSVTDEPFRFRNVPNAADSSREPRDLAFHVAQEPSRLKATQVPQIRGSPRMGEMYVDMESAVDHNPGGGGNVHYTDVTRSHATAYVSTWDIKVRALAEIAISTTHETGFAGFQEQVSTDLPIEFEMTISARSGWPLEGVEYDSSNTFLEDIWQVVCDFLDLVWDALTKVFDWILDGITAILSLVRELIGDLLSYAQDILRAIEQVVETILDLLRTAASAIANLVGDLVETIVGNFESEDFALSVLGGEMKIGLNKGNGTIVLGTLNVGGLEAVVALIKLSETNLTDEQVEKSGFGYDILTDIDITAGALTFVGKLDPVMVFQSSFFGAEVTWGEDWRIDLEVPRIERFFERRYSLEIPSIPTPIGTLDVELGLLFRLSEELQQIDLEGIVSRSFDAAWKETLGEEMSLESAAGFVQRGISGAVDGLTAAVLENVDKVLEIVLYLEGQLKVGGAAGIGVRLSVTVGKSVLRECLEWLSGRLQELIGSFGGPPSIDANRNLLEAVATDTFLGFGVLLSIGTPRIVGMLVSGSQGTSEVVLVISVKLNVATIATLLGKNIGDWGVEFGICVEDLPPGLVPDTRPGETAQVWLLRGSATPLT